MNPDLDVLRQLIKEEAVVTVKKNQYGKYSLELKEVLEEPGKKPSEYKINILDPPQDAIAIKSDAFPPPERIFSGTKGERKRADFVIIATHRNRNWIVYIEMKRGNPTSEWHIIQQLRGSKCFIDYCRAVGRTFWEEPGFLEEKGYQQRFISVKNISVDKWPSKITWKKPLHDRPENMLKISRPPKRGIKFGRLLGPAR